MSEYAVIVDVEATCCDLGSIPRHEMEIIEIGAVAVRADSGEVVMEFQAFVHPVRHPQLTDFCRKLTSISQDDVDRADYYHAVMASLRHWLAHVENHDFCSWGFYDRKQFEQDCEYHGIAYPFAGRHRNLKIEFANAMGFKKKFGVSGALKKLGIEFDGRPHRGIDDARNIARIFAEVIAGRSQVKCREDMSHE